MAFAASAAQADLCTQFSERSFSDSLAVLPATPAPAAAPSLTITANLNLLENTAAPRSEFPTHGLDTPAQSQAVQLPAPPRADILCFTGLLSIGALRLARRATGLHLSLPEWYHPYAPAQIGGSVRFDFQFVQQPAFAARVSIVQEPCARAVASLADGDRDRLGLQQHLLPTAAPRGPPTISYALM